MKRRNLIVTLTLSALFCTLIIIGSFIRIPMPNMMPVTLQTFFVLLTALVLPMKASVLAISAYAALGLIGLPIFSGGGGIGYVLMPNFGFIIGFLIATVIIIVIQILFHTFLIGFDKILANDNSFDIVIRLQNTPDALERFKEILTQNKIVVRDTKITIGDDGYFTIVLSVAGEAELDAPKVIEMFNEQEEIKAISM